MDKQKRYRRKCLASGLCQRCGKEAAPYSACDKCRLRKNLSRALRKMIVVGGVIKIGDCFKSTGKRNYVTKKVKPDDPRKLPRMGYRPLPADRLEDILVSIIKENGEAMHEKDILRRYAAIKRTATLAAKALRTHPPHPRG